MRYGKNYIIASENDWKLIQFSNVRNCSFVFRREKRNGKRGIAFERYSIIPKQIDISSDCVYRLVKS